MNARRFFGVVNRRAYYLFQKATRYNIDRTFEQEVRRQATEYMVFLDQFHPGMELTKTVNLENIDIQNSPRFSVVREDIYRRFVAEKNGPERDELGRVGRWIPRGSRIYFDADRKEYLKLFDDYFCRRGEGRFLREALQKGIYHFLCPNLSYIIIDDTGTIRGYAIQEGIPLTPYEFERYVGVGLKDLICELTTRTGLYFYDLVFHNVIRTGNRLSIIDLESVLPISWFGMGVDFSLEHLSEIDIGWPIQTKWRSPRWYHDFLLTQKENVHSEREN